MIKRKQIYLIVVSFAAMVVMPWGVIQPRALDDIRNFAFDAFQRQSPRAYDPDAPVRVIGIDEESLALYGQWPWPRKRLADLTRRLNDLGAEAIVYDMIFAESDRANIKSYISTLAEARERKYFEQLISTAPDGDSDFASAIKQSTVVLGEVVSESSVRIEKPKAGFVILGDNPSAFLVTYQGMIAPFHEFYEATSGVGATNWLPDHDQVVRRIPLVFRAGNEFTPSLALEALRVAQGAQSYIIKSSNASYQTAFGKKTGVNAIKVGNLEIQTGPAADIRPRYSYAHYSRSISARSVLEGSVPRSQIEGRIIFVGARAVGLGDFRATPLEPAVAGVEVHAQLVESLLSGALLSRPDWALGLELVVAVISFLLTMALLFFASPLVAAACGPSIVMIFIMSSFCLYEYMGLLIDPIYPSAVVLGGYLVGSVTLWRVERMAHDQVSRAFGKFVAPAVVERIAENPGRLVLGGETRDLSILFCDLRNFSTISEGLSAADLTRFMNNYFTPLTDAILNHDGTIDKYIGDSVMAFWNAPLDIQDHQLKSAKAALMMRDALKVLNEDRVAHGQEKIAFGVGLHSGSCSVGNMGSNRRFDYSILGDAVNLASRLEGVCKILATDILATVTIRDATPDLAWLDLGLVRVVGRTESVQVFALVGDELVARSNTFIEWRRQHISMMDNYRKFDFESVRRDVARIETMIQSPWKELYDKFKHRSLYHANNTEQTPEEPILVLRHK